MSFLLYFGFFLLASVSAGEKYISVCSEEELCQNFTSYGEVIHQLEETELAVVGITLLSHNLTEVVYFRNLSSTLVSLSISGRGEGRGGENAVITCTGGNAGLFFSQVVNLSVSHMTMLSCGFNMSLDMDKNLLFRTAVYLEGCTDVQLKDVTVNGSSGSGVTMVNNKGVSSIQNCDFSQNSVEDSENGGNGFYLLLSNVNNSKVTLHGCRFMLNTARAVISGREAVRFGVGGGIFISIARNSSSNLVSVRHCSVTDNKAIWGGGMYFQFHGSFPTLNAIKVLHTNITGNCGYKYGGGGVDIGYITYNHDFSSKSDNVVNFRHTRFVGNSATLFGGGVAIFGTRTLHAGSKLYHIKFEDCQWEYNTAVSSGAIDIAPIFYAVLGHGVFPKVYFANCLFYSNSVHSTNWHRLNDYIAYSKIGTGTLTVEGFLVAFQGNVTFEKNSGSGLMLSSATAEFLNGTDATFFKNKGRNGGAITMYGLSSILVKDNTYLRFIENEANFKGGAIYVSSNDIQEYASSRQCFILLDGVSESNRSINFLFKGNTAKRVGKDVYASSTQACSRSYGLSRTKKDAFSNIGEVIADDFDLVTNAVNFAVRKGESNLQHIVPGRSYSIPIEATDEFDQHKNIIFEVVNETDKSSIRPESNFITNNTAQFNGDIDAHGLFRMESASFVLEFNISSQRYCPPGYLPQMESCVCGEQSYFGVASCNNEGAHLLNGLWIGRCSENALKLCSAHCPLGFCDYNQSLEMLTYTHKLPSRVEDLNDFICGPSRYGVLCGSCRANYSAYYHSYKYTCGQNNTTCKFGILLYFVSELLPLTLMFLVVLLLEVRFTSGGVNGFVLFAQVLDSISIDANGVIGFPSSLQVVTDIHRFIYRNFNFDFFSIESLSFCLWRNATVLDAMTMKYVTVLYAILLLVVVVLVLNLWKCSKHANYCFRYRTLKSTVIHGLTTFAVICYSQCARISFQIVTPTILYGVNYTVVDRIVFRRGDYLAFSHSHLRYAIPAILILVVMSVLPLFLIMYPLIFKLLAYFNLNETMFASVLSRLFPIPLLDTFQSSFKDKYRFFAGFYFLYRLFALFAYAFSNTLVIFYTVVEFQLVIILTIHAIVQPYKKTLHNVIDSLIFSNLAIINGITLYNYITVIASYGNTNTKAIITGTASMQALLIYFPLIVMAACLLMAIVKWMKARLVMDMPSDNNLIDSVNLPPLRDIEYSADLGRGMKEPFLVNHKVPLPTENGTVTSTY